MAKYRLAIDPDEEETQLAVTEQGFALGENTAKTGRFRLAIDEAQEAPPPEMTAGRAGGLAARMGIQAIPSAVAGLPALAMDAYDSLRNGVAMVSNAVLPESMEQPILPPFRHSGMVADVGTRMADAAGTPQPATQMERGVVDIGSAALSGLGGAGVYKLGNAATRAGPTVSMVMEELGRGPVLQGLSAAGGVTASNFGQNAGLPPEAVMGLGVLGGITTGVGVTGATRLGGAARSAYRPYTTAGRDVIAGKVLNRFATRPAMAQEYMENSVELVPGSQPTISQVSRDPGLIAFENAARSTLDTGAAPGGGNRVGMRYSDQNTARQAELTKAAGTTADLEAAKKLKARTFQDLAAPSFAGKSPVGVDPKPVFDRINTIRGTFDGKREPVQKALKYVEGRLSQPGVDYTDPEQLYAIRKDLNLARQGKLNDNQDLKFAKGQIGDVIKTLDRVIEQGAPGYSRYMRMFAERAQNVENMKTLQGARSSGAAQMSDPVTNEETLVLGPFQRAIEGAAAKGKMDKMTTEQMRVVQSVVNDLDRAAAPTSNVARVPGSDTMRNFSVGSVIGRILGDNPGPAGAATQAAGQRGVGAALSWLYSMPDEQVGQLLVDAVLEPKLAARLMKAATAEEIERVSRELAWRSRVGTTSSAIYGQSAE